MACYRDSFTFTLRLKLKLTIIQVFLFWGWTLQCTCRHRLSDWAFVADVSCVPAFLKVGKTVLCVLSLMYFVICRFSVQVCYHQSGVHGWWAKTINTHIVKWITHAITSTTLCRRSWDKQDELTKEIAFSRQHTDDSEIWLQLTLLSTTPWRHMRRGINALKPSDPTCPTRFNTLNSAFCPQSVFVCSVWFSRYTATVLLNTINPLNFIADTECVSCEVRTEFLYII
jgi:hypothetical protein